MQAEAKGRNGKGMLLLQFQAGDDRYGLDVAEVIEVVPRVLFREIPHADPVVAGLMNYRGRTVPVIDLTALLTGAPSRPFFSTRIVLVHTPGRDGTQGILGLLAERVTETVACDEADFQPTGITVPEARYLGELCLRPDGAIQRVATARLLTPELREALFPPPEEA